MKNNYAALLICASLALGGLVPTTAQAQADFRVGYIVKLSGDTVRGEVDYRSAISNGAHCRFRPTASATESTFEPSDLRGYGLSQERKSFTSFALPDSAARFFLETIVSGPASLYYLRDEQQHERYYIATARFPLTELIYRKVRVVRDYQPYIEEQNSFRNTLAQALPGCPAVQRRLATLSFYERNLIKIVEAYNQCLNPGKAPATAPQQSLQVGVVLGVAQTRLTLNGGGMSAFFSNTVLYDNLRFTPTTVPIIGVSLRVPLSRLNHNVSLGAELYYEAQRYGDDFTPQGALPIRAYNRLEFDLAYLRLPISVRYTFPGKVRPLLEAGPTLAYALKKTNTGYVTYMGGTSGTYQIFENDGFRSMEYGVMFGTGVQTNFWQGRRATFLLRYERSNGFSDYVATTTSIQRVYGLFIFDLTK